MFYKYKPFGDFTMKILTDRELYFSPVHELNDPLDCQAEVDAAIRQAKAIAEAEHNSGLQQVVESISSNADIARDLARLVEGVGVLSLTRHRNDALMWAHYAENSQGLVLGFELSERFTQFNVGLEIIGSMDVNYTKDNPYLEFLLDTDSFDRNTYPLLMAYGLSSKSMPWEIEGEYRVLRKTPGISEECPARACSTCPAYCEASSASVAVRLSA